MMNLGIFLGNPAYRGGGNHYESPQLLHDFY